MELTLSGLSLNLYVTFTITVMLLETAALWFLQIFPFKPKKKNSDPRIINSTTTQILGTDKVFKQKYLHINSNYQWFNEAVRIQAYTGSNGRRLVKNKLERV
jgi:hypothetical protein